MTILQLQYFLAVADTGNFTHAAKQMYSSQPTLSRQIKMLEAELGYPLFQRNKKPLQLTYAGQLFYDGMKEAISQMNYTKEIAKAAAHGKAGSLSIGFLSSYYAEYMYLPVLNNLRESCPSLRIRCDKMNVAEQIAQLQDERLDVAIGLNFVQYAKAGLRLHPLKEAKTLLILSASHRLSEKNTLDRDDLNGETFYLPEPMEEFQLEEKLRDSFSLYHTRQIEVPSTEIAYLKVLSENGLTISNPYDPALQNNPLYHCIQINIKQTPYICAVTNPQNTNAARALFIELIKNV